MGTLLTVIGVSVPVIIFVLTVTFKLGQHAARLEALEEWKTNVRGDLHEVSEQMAVMNNSLTSLATLIEERTQKQLPLQTAAARAEALQLVETAKAAALEILASAAKKAATEIKAQ
jgi:hypothetical protein